MQNTTGNKIKLGIFVSTGIVLLIIGIYFIGQQKQLFGSTFRLSGIFKDISGLQIGNNVRFSGINVGVIDEITQITDSTVKVDMVINKSTQPFLKKSAKALIGSDGLMGNKIMIIVPGGTSRQVVRNNDILETVRAINMDDILLKLKITSDNSASITSDLAAIMQNIRAGNGTIGKLFFDSAFAENVDQALINIRQGAGGFKKNMDAASHNFLLRGYFKKKNK